MRTDQEHVERVRARFESVNLHDCQLLGVRMESRTDSEVDTVRLDLGLISGKPNDPSTTPGILTFERCAAVMVNVDFWGKRACSHAISEVTCERNPDRTAEMLLEVNPVREEVQPISQLLLFTIVLIPPGGEVRIVAEDFTFSE